MASRVARKILQASSIVMRGGASGGRSRGSGLRVPVYESASRYVSAIRCAFSQSAVPVALRENVPASVPETKIIQGQRFQPSSARRIRQSDARADDHPYSLAGAGGRGVGA